MTYVLARRVGSVATAALASMALLAGCVSSGNDGGGSSGAGNSAMLATESQIIGAQETAGEPTEGGTLSFAGYSMPNSLDPTVTQASGATGGTEMAAVYDILMRYDANNDTFVPQLAESLDEGDDHLTYTLTLRSDVRFSDGTPMTAQSVVESINRFNGKRGANSDQFVAGVKAMQVTDPVTVVFHLHQPWKEFPALLTFGHGMIVAPAGYADPANFRPIGAGPYSVQSFAPGSSLTVTPRADWWNGTPHLDSIKFVDIRGDQVRVDTLNSGGIQMAYLRTAEQVKQTMSQYPGYIEPISLTTVLNINNRDGHPGSDPLVRKAIAYAIDPDILNQRANRGLGSPGKLIFQDWSKWHTDVDPIPTDPDKATQLLAQAKANGFDGTIKYLVASDPVSNDVALAVQSMLDRVGFTTKIEHVGTATDLIKRVYVDQDFDLSHGARSISDAVPSMRLASSMHSGSANNVFGYNSPAMDHLLARPAGHHRRRRTRGYVSHPRASEHGRAVRSHDRRYQLRTVEQECARRRPQHRRHHAARQCMDALS